DYHWRDGIGPAEQRPKRVNIHWGNYVEDNSFGTHEFIGLCRLLGAEPYLAGNVGSGSPGELRAWVEYCNYPANSTLAEERAPNGTKIALFLDEWGVWDRMPHEDEQRYGRLWQQSTMRSAVAAGLGLNFFNRQADKLYMCNIAQIVNVLQSLLLTDGPEGRRCIRTTTYYAFALFRPHRGNTAVRVNTDDSSPLALSVSASKRENNLIISLVNPRSDLDIPVVCNLRGVRAAGGSAQILHDQDLNA